MKSIKEFREFINNWALPINTNFFDLDTNNQEILENNSPFIDVLRESLTYITDQWTDWTVSITNTNYRYNVTFKGTIDFEGLKQLISHLNAIKHHLDDSINKFKFLIDFDNNEIELKIFINFEKVNKGVNVEDIFIERENDDYLFILSLSKLEDYLEFEMGYKMELEQDYDKGIIINCKLEKYIEEDSEELDKFCDNFSKALSNVFERFKDDGLDYEYYFKNDYNIIISFHGWNGDNFEIAS